ncbi:hypothetical protein, variant [Saprolegnia diclina VS20]|nr:hypothetical protein, variant [Saprolegnia diclina VS20]EQC32983.1 hypothetical protein, variant [Saprolegnia diclina VS20]|eukprot:XP_008613669.1 hypothetical protein, variant [Saprolegnia diclina VS20]
MLCETKRGILLDVFATTTPSPIESCVVQYDQLNSLQAGAVSRKLWTRSLDIAGLAFWKANDVALGTQYVIESVYACDEMNLAINQLTDASAGKTLLGEMLPLWWFKHLRALSDLNFSLKYAWLLAHISSISMKYAQLKVYRDKIFDESLYILLHMQPAQLCTLTRVTMLGESGVDAGGIQREWYTVLTAAVFDPAKGLFVLATDFAYALNPTSATAYGPDHLLCYRAIGRLLGRAVLDGQVLPCRLALPLFKAILGTPLSLQDVRYLDTQTYSSLQYLLEHDVSELGLDFSAAMPATLEVVDLVPNGRQIAVTNDNKASYVDCMVRHLLFDRVAAQLTSLLKGVYEVLPQELLMPFDYKELELVLCGVAEVDVADWKASTSVSTTLRRSESLNWFWDVLEHDMSRDDRSKLLQFTTGSSRVPVQGFRGLTSYDGTLCPFSLQAVAYSVGVLPKAHSCFNRLDLPLYPTRALMHEALFALVEIENLEFTIV